MHGLLQHCHVWKSVQTKGPSILHYAPTKCIMLWCFLHSHPTIITLELITHSWWVWCILNKKALEAELSPQYFFICVHHQCCWVPGFEEKLWSFWSFIVLIDWFWYWQNLFFLLQFQLSLKQSLIEMHIALDCCCCCCWVQCFPRFLNLKSRSTLWKINKRFPNPNSFSM